MGQEGQEGQIRGSFKFTNLPPTSKLDRLLASFGGGQMGQMGQEGQGFQKRAQNSAESAEAVQE